MILKKIGEKQLWCEKKDGTKKWFKANAETIKYAGENLKVGDSITAEFDKETYVITSVKKFEKGGSNYKGGYQGGYNKGGYQKAQDITEISVYKTVATIITALKDVTVKNVEEVVKKLYEQGLKLVKPEVKKEAEKPVVKEEVKEDKEPGTSEPKEPGVDDSEEPGE